MNEDKKRPAPNAPAKTGNKKGKNQKKGKTGLIVIITLVLLIGGLIVLYTLNLFGFREDVVLPYLRNAPLIGGLFPPAEEESEILPLEQRDPRELVNMIRALERELEELRGREQDLLERSRNDALRIARLLPFHEHWVEYQRVSAEFNAIVARGEPESFLRFMEYIMPEFYEQLTRDALALHAHQENITDQVRTLSNMQESNAAEILVDLRTTDPVLLLNLLNAMSSSLRGAILDEMEPETAASMFRMMSIAAPVLTPLAPALFTPELPLTYEDLIPPEHDPEGEEPTDGAD
jgi:hypothetical protein